MRVNPTSNYSNKKSFGAFRMPPLKLLSTEQINAFARAKIDLGIIAQNVNMTMFPVQQIIVTKNLNNEEKMVRSRMFLRTPFEQFKAKCFIYFTPAGLTSKSINHMEASVSQSGLTFKNANSSEITALHAVNTISTPLDDVPQTEEQLAGFLVNLAKRAKERFFKDDKVVAEMKRLQAIEDAKQAAEARKIAIARLAKS